jgi:hypothetical protein
MGNRLTTRKILISYCVLIIIGLVFSFLGIFLSLFTICLPLFGHSACAPIGSYILILTNLPGYIFAALILPNAKTIPEIYSIIVVGGVSILFYYFLGKLFEVKKGQSVPLKRWIIRIAIGSTILLLLLFVYLLLRVRM